MTATRTPPASPAPGRPATIEADAVLDAAARLVARQGLRATSLADVATEAGVSRRSVYRYFGDRDGLTNALIDRERDRFVARALDASAGKKDLTGAARAALRSVLADAASNPLLATIRRTDPDVLLPALASSDGPVLDLVSPVVAAFAERFVADRDPLLAPVAVDAITRLLVSYVAEPPSGDVDATAAALAELFVPLLERARSEDAR